MTDFDASQDPLKSPAASRQSYKVHELAKELDTSKEQIRKWIREGNIQPMSDKEHAEHYTDTIEQFRTLQQNS